jgi:hypothetical protein
MGSSIAVIIPLSERDRPADPKARKDHFMHVSRTLIAALVAASLVPVAALAQYANPGAPAAVTEKVTEKKAERAEKKAERQTERAEKKAEQVEKQAEKKAEKQAERAERKAERAEKKADKKAADTKN